MLPQTNTTPLQEETAPQLPTPLFLNADVLSGKIGNSFTSHYLLNNNGAGQKIVELSGSRAGIVMSKPNGYDAWLKSDFQRLAKSDVPSELLAKAMIDFGVTEEDLPNLCTVGCGTNVLMRLSDGLFYVAVERTAPQRTDSGSVNAGAYSRAAGGSTGDIDLTAFTELNEELFIVANVCGVETSISILPQIYQVSQQAKDDVLQTRRQRFPQILAANGVNHISLNAHFEIQSTCIDVPDLTETVIERTIEGDKPLHKRVFSYSPTQKDINGIDAITVVNLPLLSSKDIVGIYDGEVNQSGHLLNRKWYLKPFDTLHTELLNGDIKMSPAPERVVKAAQDIKYAIHRELSI